MISISIFIDCGQRDKPIIREIIAAKENLYYLK